MKTRRPAATDRQLALLWLVAAVSSVALKPLWLAAGPMLRPCVFRSLTGFACPSCGTTRAAMALLEGNLLASLTHNPLAAIVGFIFIAGAPIAVIWTFAGWPLATFPSPLPSWIRIAAIALILVNWLYLMISV